MALGSRKGISILGNKFSGRLSKPDMIKKTTKKQQQQQQQKTTW